MDQHNRRIPAVHAPAVPPAVPHTGLQRVGRLAVIVDLLREHGMDPGETLAAVGLPVHAIADAENRIPFRAVCALLHEATLRTGLPHFPLLVAARWNLADLGIVGELVKSAATLGEALEVLSVYQQINSSGGAAILEVSAGTAGLGYAIYEPDAPHTHVMHEAVLALGVTLVRELVGPLWQPTEVLLTRRPPANDAPYRRHFRAPIRFDSDRSVLLFPRRDLEIAIRTADRVRFAALEALANAASRGSLPSQLRRALRLMLLQRIVSGDAAADMLAMHRRTLNRRLRACATTFQRELDRVRFDVACQLLATTHMPATEVAFALCYEDASSFIRAFRRWTGSTPARWRSEAARKSA